MNGLIRSSLAALLLALPAAAVVAQAADETPPSAVASELDRLRESAALEQQGDVAGAERIVRAVLAANPASLSALLSLERLVNVQGRPGDVLEPVERLLASDPRSAVGHQLRLRVLAGTADDATLEAAAAAWIRAAPSIEPPYREAAAAWRQRGQPQKAIELLVRGRRQVGAPDALALELGDAHLDAGDVARAADEWALAVGADGRGFMLVQRRLHELPDGGIRAMPRLVDALARSATPGRLRAAALLAIEARLEERALQSGHALVAAAPTDAEPYVAELARRADHAGLAHMAAWAYGELLRRARDPGATLALRARLAELAVLTGDTAGAANAWNELERASATDSPDRRHALALRVRIAAREGDRAGAAAELAAFRTEFPHAAELDSTAAIVAGLHMDAGDGAAAERILAGIAGPQSARLRGRLAVAAGDLALAREELLAAAAQLRGAAATETLALAALLMRVSPRGAAFIAPWIDTVEGQRDSMVWSAVEETRDLPAAERSPVLEFIAGVADRAGRAEDAEAIRHEIVRAAPRSREAASALLALARRAQERPDGAEEAALLLERLILEHPRSTLAPQARQELSRLRQGTPSS